jgi:lysophospholipase L1-like esterase
LQDGSAFFIGSSILFFYLWLCFKKISDHRILLMQSHIGRWQHTRSGFLAATFFLLSLALGHTQQPPTKWIGSWAAAQQTPEPRNALPVEDMRDATLRQIVHLSIGGDALRIRLSNAFGTAPLHLTAVHIARPRSTADSAIDPATDKTVMFNGQNDVTIPAGTEYLSDPVPFNAPPLSDLAISIHYDLPPQGETGHPGSRATSYYVHGDAVAAPSLPEAKKIEHWYQLSEIDVAANTRSAAVVTLGDSITDGHGATTNGNDRWTDVLARNLQASPATASIGVLNVGIGGNRVLLDDLGPNALARFDRDVLARTGASFLIVLEGVNDLGTLTKDGEVPVTQHQKLVQQLLGAYSQLIERAHARGILVVGATILPYGNSAYYHPSALSENDRQSLNSWIRTPGHFDAIADFDRVVADPQHPDQMRPLYDSGDHLHPSPAGYHAMADAVPIALFSQEIPTAVQHLARHAATLAHGLSHP